LENMMTDETFYVNAEMCDKIKAETCACWSRNAKHMEISNSSALIKITELIPKKGKHKFIELRVRYSWQNSVKVLEYQMQYKFKIIHDHVSKYSQAASH
jgi:hypothetical protein